MKIAIVYDRFSLEKVANWVRQNENMLKNYEIYTDSRLTSLINREIPKTRTVDLGETEDTNTIAALKCVEGKVDRVVHIIDMERNSEFGYGEPHIGSRSCSPSDTNHFGLISFADHRQFVNKKECAKEGDNVPLFCLNLSSSYPRDSSF
jgi:hypothetical protein